MNKLKEGDKAPDFSGVDQNGQAISLSQFKGNKVILYFYPKDNTSGCTAEACNLKDNYNSLLEKGLKIIGVSVDSMESHQKFIHKYSLPFPLIADTGKTIVNAYSVWGEKSNYGKTYEGTIRTTFIISEQGMIEKIITNVKTADHANQILESIKV
jgi:thioredoxin-dependent peroxiredoxin